MTPAAFIQSEKNRNELFDWVLSLIPADGGGTDLSKLPAPIEEQLRLVGIRDGTPIDKIRAFNNQTDWAHDAYKRLLNTLPETLKPRLAMSQTLSVGAINDAEFNGYVYQCDGGHAIVVPSGALLLISFAAELYTLHASPNFQRAIILGDHSICGWREPPLNRLRRSLRCVKNLKAIEPLYPSRVAIELEILIRRYADLGVADPPDLVRGQVLPLFPSRLRAGHPLEAGNHLRELGIRFLLLHECGHILCNHFDDFANSTNLQEFEADLFAFNVGLQCAKTKYAAVASVLGAWLILAVARRLEASDGAKLSNETHPPAEERLGRLRDFVRKTELLSRGQRSLALSLLDEAQNTDAELSRAATEFSEFLARRGNTLTAFIAECVKDKQFAKFMDQVPRWIFQGAPTRLCRALGASRVELEHQLRRDPNNNEAKSILAVIMRIFDASERHSSPALQHKLQESYLAALRG